MKNLFIFLSTIMFWAFSCGPKEDKCSYGEVEIHLPVEVYGLKDTLTLGDTLRVALHIPDQMPDSLTGDMYEFIDYQFYLIGYILRIDTIPTGHSSYNNATWKTIQGKSILADNVYLMLPEFKEHFYNYEVLIVPKKKGVYLFGMASDANRAMPLKPPKGPCHSAVDLLMNVVNQSDIHYEYIFISPDSLLSKISEKQFRDYGGFGFWVK